MVEMHIILVLLSYLATRIWAESYNPIISQISSGNNDCNRSNLIGNFDLKTVPQLNALCNIPVPDIKQSDFLLENNVVPILCMGLMDASLRLCKLAKDNITPFEDIFPASDITYEKTFSTLSKSDDFSVLDVFCSTTVKKFMIKEAASNISESWWQILNEHLSDKNLCLEMCHSNEGKVHPLCSYILWSNGIYVNNQKNNLDASGTPNGEEQTPILDYKVEEKVGPYQGETANQEMDLLKNDFPNKPTETIIISNVSVLSKEKSQVVEGVKTNFTSGNNVGTVSVLQVVTNEHSDSTLAAKVKGNNSMDFGRVGKKSDLHLSEIHKINETATTSIPSKSNNNGTGNVVRENQVSSASLAQSGSKASEATIPSIISKGRIPVVPELNKQEKVKQSGELEKASPVIFEEDISPEVTPATYTDEGEENGDGDDVNMEESIGPSKPNSASNDSQTVISKTDNTRIDGFQRGPLEGDRVYGDGEILIEDHFIEAEDSHFFTYFLCMAVLTIMAYLAFHNKKKLIALAVEGRRTKGGRRRPNSSHYSKLDCSLEEALVSNSTASVTHVLY